MKFALMAATALAFAAPAYAQDTTTAPPPEDPTMSTTAPETQTPPNTSTTPADPMSQTPSSDPMAQSMSGTGSTTGTMTNGGYAPSTPPMAGAPQPGAQVVFRPSAPVSQAFPPPPAKESYPTCSRSVKDGCRNPGGQ